MKLLLYGHFTACNITELWNQQTPGGIFLSDVMLLDDAAQYPSCDGRSVGSIVLMNSTLNTATVAYYTGTTPGSTVCFVCNDWYELNTTISARFCKGNGLWSGDSIACSTLYNVVVMCIMGEF